MYKTVKQDTESNSFKIESLKNTLSKIQTLKCLILITISYLNKQNFNHKQQIMDCYENLLNVCCDILKILTVVCKAYETNKEHEYENSIIRILIAKTILTDGSFAYNINILDKIRDKLDIIQEKLNDNQKHIPIIKKEVYSNFYDDESIDLTVLSELYNFHITSNDLFKNISNRFNLKQLELYVKNLIDLSSYLVYYERLNIFQMFAQNIKYVFCRKEKKDIKSVENTNSKLVKEEVKELAPLTPEERIQRIINPRNPPPPPY